MIFICAGLGGGTGSGAAPYVAQLAREAGSLVVAFVTLPFSFEGKRRAAQAREALARLNQVASTVICFENDQMGDMVPAKAGIHQAFATADIMVSQSVRSIVNLIQRPGLVRIGFDDLLAALRSRNGRCVFGFGESDSDNRAHDALTQALRNPLMGRGQMLADATCILVHVTGGPGMTLSEVEVLMQELGRYVNEQTQILFGAAVDGRMGNRLSVTIISSVSADVDLAMDNAAPVAPPLPIWEQQPEPETKIDIASGRRGDTDSSRGEPEPIVMQEVPPPPPVGLPFEQRSPVEEIVPAPAPEIRKPEPGLIAPKKKPAPAPIKESKPDKVQAKQEVLQFEPVTRGRFEKSEPTIVEGQDLDVPTFLRKNVRVK